MSKLWVKLGLGIGALLAIGFAIFGIIRWYQGQIDDAFDRGQRAAYDAVAIETNKTAVALNTRAAELRGQAHEQNRAVTAAATDLRMSGPGRAACPAASTGDTGGHEQAATETGNPVGGVHSPGGSSLAAVRWDDLVTVVENHDRLLIEAAVCRQFLENYSEILIQNKK